MGTAAESLWRIAEAAERLNPQPLPVFRQPGKEYDGLGRQLPVNPFRGKRGLAWLLSLGLGAQFKAVVPAEYRLGRVVLCVCEALVAVAEGEVVECPGNCGRWFLGAESSVRVARWEVEA